MKTGISLLGMFLLTGTAFGQYAGDAFRYSEITQTGTARFRGLGGNHAALGGDASSSFGNPAGLGFYNRSELSISPSLNLTNTQSTYIGQGVRESKVSPNVGQLGIVIAGNAQSENRRWRRTALGVTYTRLNSLTNRFSFQGRNNVSSIADSYIERANNRQISGADLDREYNTQTNQANNLEAAAYQLFLINGTERPNNQSGPPYFRYDPNAPTDQRNTFESTGGQSQWTFTYAGNYQDKLYLGASFGLTRLRYDFDNIYNEDVIGGRTFNRIGQTDRLTVSGNGLNVSLGMIYRLDPNLQIGASLISPTFTNVRETFEQSVTIDARDPNLPVNRNTIDIVPNNFEYALTSPLRASGGATLFLGPKRVGFITASAEYVGYAGMRVSTTAYNAQGNRDFREDVRQEIQSTYQNVVNFRAGAEFRAGLLRLRGGAAYLADPYKQRFDNLDRTKLLVSGGLGVRTERYFADISGTVNTFKSAYTPYTLARSSDYASAQITNRLTNVMLSVGVFF